MSSAKVPGSITATLLVHNVQISLLPHPSQEEAAAAAGGSSTPKPSQAYGGSPYPYTHFAVSINRPGKKGCFHRTRWASLLDQSTEAENDTQKAATGAGGDSEESTANSNLKRSLSNLARAKASNVAGGRQQRSNSTGGTVVNTVQMSFTPLSAIPIDVNFTVDGAATIQATSARQRPQPPTDQPTSPTGEAGGADKDEVNIAAAATAAALKEANATNSKYFDYRVKPKSVHPITVQLHCFNVYEGKQSAVFPSLVAASKQQQQKDNKESSIRSNNSNANSSFAEAISTQYDYFTPAKPRLPFCGSDILNTGTRMSTLDTDLATHVANGYNVVTVDTGIIIDGAKCLNEMATEGGRLGQLYSATVPVPMPRSRGKKGGETREPLMAFLEFTVSVVRVMPTETGGSLISVTGAQLPQYQVVSPDPLLSQLLNTPFNNQARKRNTGMLLLQLGGGRTIKDAGGGQHESDENKGENEGEGENNNNTKPEEETKNTYEAVVSTLASTSGGRLGSTQDMLAFYHSMHRSRQLTQEAPTESLQFFPSFHEYCIVLDDVSLDVTLADTKDGVVEYGFGFFVDVTNGIPGNAMHYLCDELRRPKTAEERSRVTSNTEGNIRWVNRPSNYHQEEEDSSASSNHKVMCDFSYKKQELADDEYEALEKKLNNHQEEGGDKEKTEGGEFALSARRRRHHYFYKRPASWVLVSSNSSYYNNSRVGARILCQTRFKTDPDCTQAHGNGQNCKSSLKCQLTFGLVRVTKEKEQAAAEGDATAGVAEKQDSAEAEKSISTQDKGTWLRRWSVDVAGAQPVDIAQEVINVDNFPEEGKYFHVSFNRGEILSFRLRRRCFVAPLWHNSSLLDPVEVLPHPVEPGYHGDEEPVYEELLTQQQLSSMTPFAQGDEGSYDAQKKVLITKETIEAPVDGNDASGGKTEEVDQVKATALYSPH